MDIKAIFENNVNEYSEYIDCDVSENMSRLYYRGMAAHDSYDDNLLSLLIWELKSVEDSENTQSELKWIYAADPSYIAPILDEYRTEAQKEDVKRTFFESPGLEQKKEKALTECGFSVTEAESRDINVTLDECIALPLAHKKAPSFVQSISLLNDQEFYQGIMNILFRYDNPSLEDLAYLPKEWYDQSVSCFTKTEDKVTGLFLVHACPSGVLLPVLFFSVGADSKMNLVEMMRFSISQAAENYPKDTIVRIHRRNREVNALSKKLFPDKKGSPASYGERQE
jgi:hypothetical protein